MHGEPAPPERGLHLEDAVSPIDATEVEALRRPLHLLVWGMLFEFLLNSSTPSLFTQLVFALTPAALIGFAMIGFLHATQHRLARTGLIVAAMITLFQAIEALLPPPGYPWISVIRIMPSLYLPVIVAHSLVALTSSLGWTEVHRSWTRTFHLTGVFALATSATSVWAASEGRIVLKPLMLSSDFEFVIAIIGFPVLIWMIGQFISSIVCSLQRVRVELGVEDSDRSGVA